MQSIQLLLLLIPFYGFFVGVQAFQLTPLQHSSVPTFQVIQQQLSQYVQSTKLSQLYAGGFEWEDPTETMLDQGVDNPYKNPDLLNKVVVDDETSGSGPTSMKIDAARLLSPRLNGANLYFVGMMGSGKSSIAKIVAKRKYYDF